ncbi:MAG: type II toxin-antitoxin system VapC family toxin [Acidobacteriota bacterium]|nr:type II toxin-antitoxin system VapC family toxin [Acidobacteriota bacterium]
MAVAVLDASVAVKLVVPEAGTAESLTVFEGPRRWLAPRLMVVEVASALRQKCAQDVLTTAEAAEALAATLGAIADGVVELADDEAVVQSALNLALTLGHKVPDCVYLALAEREGAMLASADRKLLALARSRGIAVADIPST